MKSNFFYLFLLFFSIVTFLAFFSSVQGKSGQVTEGQELFKAHCAKCHGQEGEGFLRLYPPLQNSRFLRTDVARLPCIMRNGLKGEIKVGDVTFNQIMPGNERLSAEHEDLDVLLAAYGAERLASCNSLVEVGRRIGKAQVEETPDWAAMSPADFMRWNEATLGGQSLYLYPNAASTDA